MYTPKAEDFRWIKGHTKRALNKCAAISRECNKRNNTKVLSGGEVFLKVSKELTRRAWLAGRT